jgi:hypothetical protein
MEFQAKVFVSVSNPGARIAELGGPFVMGSAVLLAVLRLAKVPDSYEFYCIGLLVLGLLCMIVGRIIAKGNMFRIGLSDTELVAGENGVRVGEEFYSHDQLTDLAFRVEGYDGLPTLRYGRFGVSRGRRNMSGAENKIHFRANGKKHLYQFYLPDQSSMSQLGQVFRIYYERRIPFRECNQGGPTFLFRQVRSKSELEEMKRREGFA